jgi:hypothetical protein
VLHTGRSDLSAEQRAFAQATERLAAIPHSAAGIVGLEEVIKATSADDPHRSLDARQRLHRTDRSRDGPEDAAADHLPALQPDLEGRSDSGTC